MDSWELIEEDKNNVEATPLATSYYGNYVYWNGKCYTVGEKIK